MAHLIATHHTTNNENGSLHAITNVIGTEGSTVIVETHIREGKTRTWLFVGTDHRGRAMSFAMMSGGWGLLGADIGTVPVEDIPHFDRFAETRWFG